MSVTILRDVFKRKRSDRERARGPATCDVLDIIENGRTPEVQHQKRTYSIGGVSLNSPTDVDKFCAKEGINPNHLSVKPNIIPESGGKASIHVALEPKR